MSCMILAKKEPIYAYPVSPNNDPMCWPIFTKLELKWTKLRCPAHNTTPVALLPLFLKNPRYQTISTIQTNKSVHYMGVSKNNGTPKSSILIGFSLINHPFWGFSPYFWKHPIVETTIHISHQVFPHAAGSRKLGNSKFTLEASMISTSHQKLIFMASQPTPPLTYPPQK